MLSVAVCTYNRARFLPELVAALRAQSCPCPYEILVVNNNSQDDTTDVLTQLKARPGVPLRWVNEDQQGIVYARNRAIDETPSQRYLVFIDDDELPTPGFLNAAFDALDREGAACVGGRIAVDFIDHTRPTWLEDDLLGFLGALDYGEKPFWIRDASMPVWSGNIGYRRNLFERHGLRFDARYNRSGEGIGGGEDAAMFRSLLSQGERIRYRPDMAIKHRIEEAKLRRAYFLRLHYLAGRKRGQFELPCYTHTLLGIPPFLIGQAARHWLKAFFMYLARSPGRLRQAMNAAHGTGLITGLVAREKCVREA